MQPQRLSGVVLCQLNPRCQLGASNIHSANVLHQGEHCSDPSSVLRELVRKAFHELQIATGPYLAFNVIGEPEPHYLSGRA
jgi:hypothetical protein